VESRRLTGFEAAVKPGEMFDRARLLGWWYVSIGLGFGLLAIRNYIYGARPGSIVLRAVIAAGFVILGITTLQTAPPRD
jgi:hypothetical protein